MVTLEALCWIEVDILLPGGVKTPAEKKKHCVVIWNKPHSTKSDSVGLSWSLFLSEVLKVSFSTHTPAAMTGDQNIS